MEPLEGTIFSGPSPISYYHVALLPLNVGQLSVYQSVDLDVDLYISVRPVRGSVLSVPFGT